jgi:hypothetical protein
MNTGLKGVALYFGAGFDPIRAKSSWRFDWRFDCRMNPKPHDHVHNLVSCSQTQYSRTYLQSMLTMSKSNQSIMPYSNVDSNSTVKRETLHDAKDVDHALIAPDTIKSCKLIKQDVEKVIPSSSPNKVKLEGVDEPKETMNEDHDVLTSKGKPKEGRKSNTKGKVRVEVQQKIMAYLGQELQVDRKHVSKQEVAEGCGFKKAGTHAFFYAWQDLERTKMWVCKSTSGKALVCLTSAGKDNIPTGVIVAAPLDNAGKQQFLKQSLLKGCNEAKAEKVDIIFDIFKDGKPHPLDEFTAATGYANMKSKGLGYPFSYMEKKMKIVEKCGDKMFQFTDKCFPDGRPA